MHDSFYKQAKLSEMKLGDYRLEAEHARMLREAQGRAPRHGLRWHLGERLLRLAARVSPSHRPLLQALSAGTPLEPCP